MWRFADFELDEKLYQLRRGEQVIKLEPTVFDLLLYLLHHRDRVVAKDELLDKVWPGQFVSESVLPRNIRVLRKVLGDDRASQRFIQTAHGRGYRFAATAVEIAADAAPSPAAASRDPFVGRAPVMRELQAALASATGGSGELALLVGEPGIGKTRTAEEFSRLARAEGARILPGHCYEGDGAPAFWPWIQVLRASLRDRDRSLLVDELGSSGAELVQLIPEMREHLAEPAVLPALDAQQVRFRLFDAVATYLRRASNTQPLVILLDDLHWADKSSLLLLRFVARELRESKVLIVACYRDIELRRGHPLAEALGELTREARCRRIPLRGRAGWPTFPWAALPRRARWRGPPSTWPPTSRRT